MRHGSEIVSSVATQSAVDPAMALVAAQFCRQRWQIPFAVAGARSRSDAHFLMPISTHFRLPDAEIGGIILRAMRGKWLALRRITLHLASRRLAELALRAVRADVAVDRGQPRPGPAAGPSGRRGAGAARSGQPCRAD